jgi:hypothetical protein
MQTNGPTHDPRLDLDWSLREKYWRAKLGRIQLGVEPVAEQLAKYRQVTWMLTAIPFGLAVMFVSLFAAFRRADIGLIFCGIVLLPVVALAWCDFPLLQRRVRRYLRERDAYLTRKAEAGRSND